MAVSGDCKDRTVDAFQPVSDMLDVGQCEPLKAAVHGVCWRPSPYALFTTPPPG